MQASVKNLLKNPIWIIFVLAAAIRLVGIFYGFGQDFFSDASVHVFAAFRMLEERTLNASFDFYYLPPLLSYFLVPFFAAFGTLGILFGKFASLADFREFVILNREYFVIGPRIISAILGAGAVLFLYDTVRRAFGYWPALAASSFLAFDFYHIHESHSGRIWAPITFFIVAALWCIWRIYDSEETKWRFFETEDQKWLLYVFAAVFIGLGYGAGYVPILILPWFFAAHFLKSPAIRYRDILFDQKLILSSALFLILIIVFSSANLNAFVRQFGSTIDGLILSPYFSDLRLTDVGIGGGPSSFLPNFTKSLLFLFDDSPLLLFFGAIGAVFLALKYRNNFISSLFIGFPLLYLLGISFGFPSIDARYILPAVPFLAILSAYAVRELADRFPANALQISLFFVLLIAGYSFWVSTNYAFLTLKPDTRIQAVRWIYDNVDPGTRVLVNMLFTHLNENKESIENLASVGGFVDVRQRYFLTLRDEQLPAPSYFVLDNQRRSRERGEYEILKPEYAIHAFWNGSESFLGAGIIPGEKELLVRLYPGEELTDLHDFLNMPENFYSLLPKLKFLGPYVEIYRLKY